MRRLGALAAALAALAAPPAHAAAIDDARAAIWSGRPVAVIGVPSAWLGEEPDMDDADRSDWRFFLDQWRSRLDPGVEVVVVPIDQLRTLVAQPRSDSDCMSLFIRDGRHALVYDAGCVIDLGAYRDAERWVRGLVPAVDAFTGLLPTTVELRP